MAGKNQTKKKTLVITLEAYKEMPVFIPVYITEEEVKSIAQKLLGKAGLGGTDLEALQGWLIKFRDNSKKLIRVESFVG